MALGDARFADHQRADTAVGEDLEQQGVRQPAVDQVDARHAGLDRLERRAQLGAHAAGGLARVEQPLDAGGVESAAQLAVGHHSAHVGEEDQLGGAHRRRHRPGDDVGVDVVRLAVGVGRGRRQHRDVLALQQQPQRPGIDGVDDADKADVLAVRPVAPHPQHAGVGAGKAHRPAAGALQARDDLFVDPPRQHHLRHLGALGVGHPMAVDETGFDAHALHDPGERRAAAVDDQRLQSDVLQQDDVARPGVGQRRRRPWRRRRT